MTLNIAHRGFSALYPENTMLAFKKAKEEGFCDGIELDVQLTKDLVPVIIHDEKLERTTGVKGFVKDFTYSEIRTFNAGENEKIPSLEEYLEFAKENNIYTNIELKNSILEYSTMEEKTLDLIDKFNFKNRIILSSFNHESMSKIKTIDKTIKTGILYDSILLSPHKYCQMCGADAMHPNYISLLLSRNSLKNMLKNNIEVNSYTINKESHMRKFIKEGITSIITNHPDKLHQILIDEKRI
ncbi:glycerophosphodiester phosphodiesterase [uncultured Clostridium sp.]|uniref:glycerophosphodiester phosphodiesterase n=1 Tax=uncultured Clostridium sp. TaxID=59620 RepID=UPI002613D40A|nr:glycerophosphodiester phosphodiesterase [uncultured Clostridium sp.]